MLSFAGPIQGGKPKNIVEIKPLAQRLMLQQRHSIK
jgi:hypothetical protein